MWKMAEEESFQQALHSKEKAHMTRLAEEWGRREQQRQQILKQKVNVHNRFGQKYFHLHLHTHTHTTHGTHSETAHD